MKCRIEFAERWILLAVQRGNNTALCRAGAYIRKAARNQVSTSEHASAPGAPPNTRRGLLKNSLLFGVEKKRQSVVIGPAASMIGTAMTAHEFGGKYRKRRYPKRPPMAPTLERTASKLPSLWEKSVR
ncbi:hypothetical protein [Victivallis sp. Marseille-Q1083]|uniref:hypothetical protein n=1 Tax=Victivallis sp. Marseille-Q1083 TaxID=2717288 RepID=UPI00158BAEBA|nr:hypothetical protein [Victivallis sp. Marseille-Q1083]